MKTVNDFNRHGLRCLAGAVLIFAALEGKNTLKHVNPDVREFYCDIFGLNEDYLEKCLQKWGVQGNPFYRYVKLKGGE